MLSFILMETISPSVMLAIAFAAVAIIVLFKSVKIVPQQNAFVLAGWG